MSLNGNLQDLGLADILQIVSLSRKSGILSLQRSGSEGRVVFLHGSVVLALSSEHPESLGEILSQSGVASEQAVQAAIELQARMSQPVRLGDVLSRNFGISSAAIDGVLRKRVRKIVLSFFDWPEGRYSFEVKEAFEPSSLLSRPFYGALERGLSPRDLLGSDESADAGREAHGTSPFDSGNAPVSEGAPRVSRPPVSPGLPLLKSMLQELHNPSLGGGIILLVLRFASEFMNRAIVFLVKEDEIVRLGQFGIENPQADKRGRGLRISLDEGSLFQAVLKKKMPAKIRLDDSPWCRSFLAALGGAMPEEAFLGPILSEGKPVALLYGDNLPEKREVGDTESLEIFLSQAGMAMEKALLERKLQGANPS
jgi:hypothetical protein